MRVTLLLLGFWIGIYAFPQKVFGQNRILIVLTSSSIANLGDDLADLIHTSDNRIRYIDPIFYTDQLRSDGFDRNYTNGNTIVMISPSRRMASGLSIQVDIFKGSDQAVVSNILFFDDYAALYNWFSDFYTSDIAVHNDYKTWRGHVYIKETDSSLRAFAQKLQDNLVSSFNDYYHFHLCNIVTLSQITRYNRIMLTPDGHASTVKVEIGKSTKGTESPFSLKTNDPDYVNCQKMVKKILLSH